MDFASIAPVALVHVCAFGATGNGSTDDSAAFIAALAAAKEVYVPEGQYRIKATVDVPSSTRLILGRGAELLGSSSGTYTAIDGYNALVRLAGTGASVVGGKISPSGMTNGCAVCVAGYQSEVAGCTMGAFAVGVYMNNHSSRVVRNTFNSCTVGVRNRAPSANGNRVYLNEFETCGKCVYVDNGSTAAQYVDGIFIYGNVFNLFTSCGVYADAYGKDLHSLVVDGNYFESTVDASRHVQMESTTGSGFHYFRIVNNLFYGATPDTYGVYLNDGGTGVLSGNEFANYTKAVKSISASHISDGGGNTYFSCTVDAEMGEAFSNASTAATSVQVADKTSAINARRWEGRMIWETTNNRPMWSLGKLSTSVWIGQDASGAVSVTPV